MTVAVLRGRARVVPRAVIVRRARGRRRVPVAVVRSAPCGAARPLDELVLAPVEVIAKIERELLGAQDLAGLVRRAVVGAATALGARVEVEDRLPREVLDARDADRVFERIGVLGRRADRLHQLLAAFSAMGCRRPRGVRSRGEDVGDRRDDVEVLRVRKEVEEDEHERRSASRSPRARER